MIKILVLEDDRLCMALLQMAFEAEGYEVETAENGQLGLAKMETFHPDLIVTDVEMPALDGLGFLDAIADAKTQT